MKKEITQTLRLLDLYKEKTQFIHFNNVKNNPEVFLKAWLDGANMVINWKIEERIAKAIKKAKNSTKLSNKKSYLKYLK